MQSISPGPFQKLNFEELSLLAVTDLAQFEELRSELIARVIKLSGCNVDRLTALQIRLNEQKKSDTPSYLSCLQLSDWLDESYQRLAQHLQDIRRND